MPTEKTNYYIRCPNCQAKLPVPCTALEYESYLATLIFAGTNRDELVSLARKKFNIPACPCHETDASQNLRS